MSKLLVNLALLNTKALVNAYTWSTLPFYAAFQRPWRQVKIAKSTFNMRVILDNQGRLVYSRPSRLPDDKPVYKCLTFAEILPTLDRTREVVGIRDVLSETAALDEKGRPIRVEGRELKKLQLAPKFRWLTVGQVMDRVDAIARGLKGLGLEKGDKALIYAENSPEWFFTGLALARLNVVCVTLFSTLNDSGVVYGINQSDAKVVITSQYLLPKVLSYADQLPAVEKIVYFENPREPISLPNDSTIPVTTLRQIETAGERTPMCEFEKPDPDDIAVIMFTSGTTGDPKGVMISHKQLFTSVQNMLRMDEEYGSLGQETDHTAYLPMAHMFGYVVNIAILSTRGRLGFCSPFTLLDSSPSHVPGQVGDIKLLKPKYFVAVPLVLERILKEIYHKLHARGPLAPALFNYFMDYKIKWTAKGYDTPIINRLICKRINDQFGGQLKMIGVSSAPLHERTQSIISAALNVKINLAYGSTENCGPASALHIDDLALGSVGILYHSFKFFLKDWPEGGYYTTGGRSSDLPRGEIYLGGDSIASGYYKLPEETAASFIVDPDGTRWFRTGDIGEMAHNMTLKIIDRKKDLQKLSNGEFVSLGKIESGLRNSPYVENICVCTDSFSNYVTALVSPNRKAMNELAKRLGKQMDTFEALCEDPAIVSKVHDSLISTGLSIGMNGKELPVKITLVPEEWTPANLLTAAFKLKRKAITDFYVDQIANMFSSSPAGDSHKQSITARSH